MNEKAPDRAGSFLPEKYLTRVSPKLPIYAHLFPVRRGSD